MRIVHVINGLGTGGAEMLVVDLAAAMQRHGHEVRVACLADVGGVPRDRAVELGVDVRVLGAHRFDPRLPFALAGVARGADVVHAHLFPAFYWAALTPLKAPVLFTEHSTWNRRMDSQLFAMVDRAVYRRLERVVAISEGTATNLAKQLGQEPSAYPVVLNGISDGLLEGPAAELPEGRRRMIIVASLENRRKDISRAVRTVAEVPGVSLSVVGEGPDRGEVEALIGELGVGDRVELLGRRGDVPVLLREHDLFLSTSRVEGFGLAAAEAMAVGLPVVAPAIPGISEVVSDGVSGLLFDPGDVGEPARSVSRVFGDRGLALRLAGDARVAAGRFTADACARAYEEQYAQLITQRAQR